MCARGYSVGPRHSMQQHSVPYSLTRGPELQALMTSVLPVALALPMFRTAAETACQVCRCDDVALAISLQRCKSVAVKALEAIDGCLRCRSCHRILADAWGRPGVQRQRRRHIAPRRLEI